MISVCCPILLLLSHSPAVPARPAEVLVIRNARIFPVCGPPIDHGTILIEGGRIRAVGGGIAIPPGARVVDATGLAVMPGIVDANARFGVRGSGNEESSEVTPEARVARLINARSPEFQRALQSGVTSACVTPGSANVVGGLCAVVKTVRRDGRTALLRDGVALRAALGADTYSGNSSFRFFGFGEGLTSIYLRRPNSRMAAVWELRKALYEAKRYGSLARVLAGELPLRLHAVIENDIRAALTIADEFGLSRVVIDQGTEAYRLAGELARRKVPVVLGPFENPHGLPSESAEVCLNSAGLLAAKGVRVAFGSNGANPGELLSWVALAVRHGMNPETALRAITLEAAAVAGVDDRVGSLEPGKDADLLVLSGEPWQVTTRILKVVVDGQVVHEND